MARKKRRSKFLSRLLAAAVAVTTLISPGTAGGMAVYAAETGTAEAGDTLPADGTENEETGIDAGGRYGRGNRDGTGNARSCGLV